MLFVLALWVLVFAAYWQSRRRSIEDVRSWLLHEGLLVGTLLLLLLMAFWWALRRLG